MTDESPPPIHVAMSRVLAALPAIGKNQRNQQQGFNFRGIDDVLNALNPLLSEHGIVIVPHEVSERISGTRQTAKGGTLFEVSLRVRYRFYGPAGDYLEAEAWGEGTDSGDKATPKAMTGAHKYVLFQAFSISTEEASNVDADRHSPDETAVVVASKAVRDDLQSRIARLAPEVQKALGQDWKQSFPPLRRLPASDAEDASDLIAVYETADPFDTPAAEAGPPAAPSAPPPDDSGRPFEEAPVG